MTSRTLIAAAALSVLLAMPGCSRTDLSGPPDLRVGRDECAECGMIVSEDRCSSAMLVEISGRREHIMFDDIGCMLDYERTRAGQFTAVDAFVHDHATRAWVRAREASFLLADRERLPTPMGSGLVAFATREAALEMRKEVGGDVIDHAALPAARADWLRARYPRAGGGS